MKPNALAVSAELASSPTSAKIHEKA